MKIAVAYDKQGKILAALTILPGHRLRPHVEAEGTSSAEIEVPSEFDGKRLHEFLHHLRVDTETRRLVKKV